MDRMHSTDRTDEALELAPRGVFVGIAVVWGAALVLSLAIALLVPEEWRMAWMTVGLGACIILAFVVQLWRGRTQGFIDRVALSTAGALLVMGLVSAGFGVAALITVP